MLSLLYEPVWGGGVREEGKISSNVDLWLWTLSGQIQTRKGQPWDASTKGSIGSSCIFTEITAFMYHTLLYTYQVCCMFLRRIQRLPCFHDINFCTPNGLSSGIHKATEFCHMEIRKIQSDTHAPNDFFPCTVSRLFSKKRRLCNAGMSKVWGEKKWGRSTRESVIRKTFRPRPVLACERMINRPWFESFI